LQRYRLEDPSDTRLLLMSSFLIDYPFAGALYSDALDAIRHLRSQGLQTFFLMAMWQLQAGCFENMVCDLRWIIRAAYGRQGQPSAAILDGRTMQSTCESGRRAGYDGYKRKRGSKVQLRWTDVR
jgi:hypothetical protein